MVYRNAVETEAPEEKISDEELENMGSLQIEENILGEEVLPVMFREDIEIKVQTPVEITDFSSALPDEPVIYQTGDRIDLDNVELIDEPSAQAVQYGSLQYYLTGTGDGSAIPVTLSQGIYIQAQMTQPGRPELDYNLYLTDLDGYVIVGSEMATLINGEDGTLPESIGYISMNPGETSYYLIVMSANGGSASEPFILDYALSNDGDGTEPAGNPMHAIELPFGTNGVGLQGLTLSAPIDNDWFYIDVQEDRNYDRLKLDISTDSSNTARYEIIRMWPAAVMRCKR